MKVNGSVRGEWIARWGGGGVVGDERKLGRKYCWWNRARNCGQEAGKHFKMRTKQK